MGVVSLFLVCWLPYHTYFITANVYPAINYTHYIQVSIIIFMICIIIFIAFIIILKVIMLIFNILPYNSLLLMTNHTQPSTLPTLYHVNFHHHNRHHLTIIITIKIQDIYLIIYWLAMSNSMYNPMIYCYMNQR